MPLCTEECKNMAFDKQKWGTAIRLLLIVASALLAAIAARQGFWFNTVVLAALTIAQFILLMRYADKNTNNLAQFLESIRLSDFSRTFTAPGQSVAVRRLSAAMEEVMEDFRKIRSEKEEQYHYLQSVIQNIDMALLVYTPEGNIELSNKAARKLFRTSTLNTLDDLDQFSPQLAEGLRQIKHGETLLVKVRDEEEIISLVIFANHFRVKSKTLHLVSLKDLYNVLEEQEAESYQKLIRVLTHEIMNSIAPISSLASTVNQMLGEVTRNHQFAGAEESIVEIGQALQTIEKRSQGLLHFVNTYRNLTRVPNPNIAEVPVGSLLSNIQKLMFDELQNRNIALTINIDPPNIILLADQQLIEQVLINLLMNSIHALTDREGAAVQIKALINRRNRPVIQVTDNGPGILQDVLDKIFIPFFSTKPNGTGIGLSLSKQIMRLHGGNITADSLPDEATTFTLTF